MTIFVPSLEKYFKVDMIYVTQQFIEMLERGDFRKNREIGYYANKLCVTPK